MTMVIYNMYMNIYIDTYNTLNLRNLQQAGGSMSGLVNELLRKHFNARVEVEQLGKSTWPSRIKGQTMFRPEPIVVPLEEVA